MPAKFKTTKRKSQCSFKFFLFFLFPLYLSVVLCLVFCIYEFNFHFWILKRAWIDWLSGMKSQTNARV